MRVPSRTHQWGIAFDNIGCGSPIPEVQCEGTVHFVDWSNGPIRVLDCARKDLNMGRPEFGNVTPFPVGVCPNSSELHQMVAQDFENDGLNDFLRAQC